MIGWSTFVQLGSVKWYQATSRTGPALTVRFGPGGPTTTEFEARSQSIEPCSRLSSNWNLKPVRVGDCWSDRDCASVQVPGPWLVHRLVRLSVVRLWEPVKMEKKLKNIVQKIDCGRGACQMLIWCRSTRSEFRLTFKRNLSEDCDRPENVRAAKPLNSPELELGTSSLWRRRRAGGGGYE